VVISGYQGLIVLNNAHDVKDMTGQRRIKTMAKLITRIAISRRKARQLMKAKFSLILSTRKHIVHHRDENPLNNKLNNLQIMTNSDHLSYHVSNYQHKLLKHRIKYVESLMNLHNLGIWITLDENMRNWSYKQELITKGIAGGAHK